MTVSVVRPSIQRLQPDGRGTAGARLFRPEDWQPAAASAMAKSSALAVDLVTREARVSAKEEQLRELLRLSVENETLKREDDRLNIEKQRLEYDYSLALARPAPRLCAPQKPASPPKQRTPSTTPQSPTRHMNPWGAHGKRETQQRVPADTPIRRTELHARSALQQIASYAGEMNDVGQAHGWGQATLSDGSVVEGQFTDGRFLEVPTFEVLRPKDPVRHHSPMRSPTTAEPVGRHVSRSRASGLSPIPFRITSTQPAASPPKVRYFKF